MQTKGFRKQSSKPIGTVVTYLGLGGLTGLVDKDVSKVASLHADPVGYVRRDTRRDYYAKLLQVRRPANAEATVPVLVHEVAKRIWKPVSEA